MELGGGTSTLPRHERGRGGPGPDRRGRRGARNMTMGGRGVGEAKSRNKTWRREDAAPALGEDQPAGQPASSPFGSFAPANGGGVNGTNGFGLSKTKAHDGGASVFGASSASPFGAPAFGGSAFGQSAFVSASAFSTTSTSSPQKRNAFGAPIDADPTPISSPFGQPISNTRHTTSAFKDPSSSPFRTPDKKLNAGAAEFKPSAFVKHTAFDTASVSVFSPASTSAFGSTSTSPFGAQPAFSAPPFSAPRQTNATPKSAFGNPPPTSAFSHPPSISASARDGGHVPTPRLRKHRPRWKTHGQPPSTAQPATSVAPRDVPPYRVPAVIQREVEQGKYAGDNRFPGNRFMELKALRPSMRAHSIRHRLISDPEHRTDLAGAITVVGTCQDMCPEYERHEREFQKDVDDWEKIPGTNPKRIDHLRAVKKYRRSAAGNDEPLESDLRPPEVLKRTLDYLFYDLLAQHGLEATYAFIRDRTRAIRTDFVIQHERGAIAVECFERIARFHILALHRFCERDDVRGFDYWQEVEQMMKTLQSLMQFYDDNEGKLASPNEAEFRAYYILAHIRDTNSTHRLQSLAPHIFLDPALQTALELRAAAQRNTHVERRRTGVASKFRNTEACLNAFTRVFKRARHGGTSYLTACLVEYHFGGVRKGAVHALWKAYTARHRPLPAADLQRMLALDSEEKALEVAARFGMAGVDEVGENPGTAAVLLNKNSKFEYGNQMAQRHSVGVVEVKRGELADVDIVDGRFEKTGEPWKTDGSSSTALVPALTSPSRTVGRKPSVVTPPLRRTSTTISFPPSSAPSPTSPVSSLAPWGVFSRPPVEVQPAPPVNDVPAPVFRVPSVSQPAFTPVFAPTPVSEPSEGVPSPVPSSWVASTPPAFPGLRIPAQRKESVFTPPMRTPERTPEPSPAQPAVLVEVQRSPVHPTPIHVETPGLPPTTVDGDASTEVELPAAPRHVSPPRPTQEELLFEQQQAARRAVALAKAHADRHFKFQIFFKVFTHWKRNVMNRGHARALRTARKEQFRRSISDMGLSTNSPAIDRKGKQRAEYGEEREEDLVSWEDMSQASSSMSTSTRRRRRKSARRADDEATLVAIKEAEATRIKLWEPGTFLGSIASHVRRQLSYLGSPLPPGWEVWLSTTLANASTAEWLRVKFSVDSSTASTELSGLHRIPLPDAAAIPVGHTAAPGVIVLDLAATADESAIQADVERLRSVISSLPPNRHYVPSVLLFQWTESPDDLPSQFSSLLDEAQRDNTIESWQTVSFTNDGRHFNDQFEEGIRDLSVDVVGKLIEKASLDDVFQMFFVPWDAALNQWIANCRSVQSGFDWVLYAKVLAVMLDNINSLAAEVLRVCHVDTPFEWLPSFDGLSIVNRQSAFETSMEYLNTRWLASNQDALLLRTELSADLSAGRDFYVTAVPERLAHLMLCKLRSSIPPSSTFFLDIKSTPAHVAVFGEAINASLVQLERRVQPRPPSTKKRNECDEMDWTTSSNGPVEAKRRKHDMASNLINGTAPVLNGRLPKQDTLSRLKATVAKARQSVEDLRSVRRDAERSMSPSDESGMWGSTRSSLSPELPSRFSAAPEDRSVDWRGPVLFDPKRDVDLPLVPRSELELVPAKSARELAPVKDHDFPQRQSLRATPQEGHASRRFHPYLDGRGPERGLSQSWSAGAAGARVRRGAASLTPRIPDEHEGAGHLARLKESVRRAKDAVEDSRRAREAGGAS